MVWNYLNFILYLIYIEELTRQILFSIHFHPHLSKRCKYPRAFGCILLSKNVRSYAEPILPFSPFFSVDSLCLEEDCQVFPVVAKIKRLPVALAKAPLSPLPVASARLTRDYWAIWEGGKDYSLLALRAPFHSCYITMSTYQQTDSFPVLTNTLFS